MHEQLLTEIFEKRTVYLVDDVSWDPARRRYTGSLLWHGMPINPVTLSAFAAFVGSSVPACEALDVVVGVVSSGVPWATALAMSTSRPLVPLRMEPHRYGVWNHELRSFASKSCILVDNYLGSGETLGRARQLVQAAGVACSRCVVLEASRAHRDVDALIETTSKLTWLLKRGYFSPAAEPVVVRLLKDPEGWSHDLEWVRTVRRQIQEHGTPLL
jgi:adenine/guanine phosphoribosyltransferase-like PRPP-binding protein